jgi:hypothetical protein
MIQAFGDVATMRSQTKQGGKWLQRKLPILLDNPANCNRLTHRELQRILQSEAEKGVTDRRLLARSRAR